MNTIVGPTKEQIKVFCSNLENSLMAAADRGALIELGQKQLTKYAFTPDYGDTPVDVVCIGGKFKAKFVDRGYEWVCP